MRFAAFIGLSGAGYLALAAYEHHREARDTRQAGAPGGGPPSHRGDRPARLRDCHELVQSGGLSALGRDGEAAEKFLRAYELEPNDFGTQYMAFRSLFPGRDYRRFLEFARQECEADPEMIELLLEDANFSTVFTRPEFRELRRAYDRQAAPPVIPLGSIAANSALGRPAFVLDVGAAAQRGR